MAILRNDADGYRERMMRVRWPVWLSCQSEAARSLGNALFAVDSFFTELDGVHGVGTYDEEREECARLISDSLGKMMSASESAFRYVTRAVPDVEDESKRLAALIDDGLVPKVEGSAQQPASES